MKPSERNMPNDESGIGSTCQEMAIRTREAYTASKPSETDVLLGRGRKVQQHPGNMSFLRKIDEFLQLYHTSERGKKREAVSMVLDWLARRGGHFVKLDIGGQWVEVSKPVAKEKVAVAFRHRKFSLKADRHLLHGCPPSFHGLFVPSPACQCCGPIGVSTIDHTKFPVVCRGTTQKSVISRQMAQALSGQQPESEVNDVDLLCMVPVVCIDTSSGTSTFELRGDFRLTRSMKSPELVSDEEILRAVQEWEDTQSNRNDVEDGNATDVDDFDYELELLDEIAEYI